MEVEVILLSNEVLYHSLHGCNAQIPMSLREGRDVVTQQSAGRQVSEDGHFTSLFRSPPGNGRSIPVVLQAHVGH